MASLSLQRECPQHMNETIERFLGLRRKKVIPYKLVSGLGAMAASAGRLLRAR